MRADLKTPGLNAGFGNGPIEETFEMNDAVLAVEKSKLNNLYS